MCDELEAVKRENRRLRRTLNRLANYKATAGTRGISISHMRSIASKALAAKVLSGDG